MYCQSVLCYYFPTRKGVRKMTEAQAREYISKLTYEEKVRLNEMLKCLGQNRQHDAVPQELADKAGE